MGNALLYRIIKGTVRAVYPEYQLTGTENLPEGSCVLVGNHAQIHGPVISQLYLPGKNYTWCAGEMFSLKEVPAYAREDFWSGKPGWQQPFWGLVSYLIAPLCAYIFSHADVIPVYRDARVMRTLKDTAEKLEDGAHAVIFPEGHGLPGSRIVAGFQQGFADVARIYSRKTGKELPFVPMYVAPSLKTVCFGSPVYSDRTAKREEEQKRISGELMERITELAMALPPHRVVPYENIDKKEYPVSRSLQ